MRVKLTIENRIAPYFKKLSVGLCDLQPHDIQKYYTWDDKLQNEAEKSSGKNEKLKPAFNQ